LVLVLGLMVVCTIVAAANPIPVPTLALEEEYIYITMYESGDRVLVEVKGVYPFKNIGYDRLVMYFPVPPSVDKGFIKVFVNGREHKWEIVDKAVIQGPGGSVQTIEYNTVLGKYVFIKWVIENPGEKFDVTVQYAHEAQKVGVAYATLYAMATGRFYYSKQCTAHVKVTVRGFEGRKLTIKLVPAPGSNNIETSFSVSIENSEETIELEEKARMLAGLDRDILVLVGEVSGTPQGRWIEADPRRVQAELDVVPTSAGLVINATLVYPHSGFKEEWSDPVVEPGRVVIDAKVYEWTGPALQVITRKTKTFMVPIQPGTYEVQLRVNGVVKASTIVAISTSSTGATAQAGFSLRRLPIWPILAVVLVVAIALIVALKLR